jgi:hypothetical protein
MTTEQFAGSLEVLIATARDQTLNPVCHSRSCSVVNTPMLRFR